MPTYGLPQSTLRAIATHEDDEPPVRTRDDDLYDPWWTPVPTRRSRRGARKPKSKGTRLSYTPPPWRGGE